MNSSSLDNRTKPEEDLESSSLLSNTQNDSSSPALNIEQSQPASNPNSGVSISSTGLKVLGLLAVQNASKNLIMRFAVQDKPDFLYSAAVIGSESTKLFLSICYILFYDKRSFASIITFLKEDKKNAILLTVPATVYNIQQTLEYVALSNLDASVFSVLVQTKLVATAGFAVGILGKHLTKVQVLSLGLLTTGVMLCNMKNTCSESESDTESNQWVGIFATLGIALSSGFASVYTEKVIKKQKDRGKTREGYSLAYMQVQLAGVSLIIIGCWATVKDFGKITENGLFHNFNGAAFVSVLTSALGGLTVAAVLKYADAVLKGYATAISVVLTGVFSMVLFGTELSVFYLLGMINVIISLLMYSGKNLYANMV